MAIIFNWLMVSLGELHRYDWVFLAPEPLSVVQLLIVGEPVAGILIACRLASELIKIELQHCQCLMSYCYGDHRLS